MARFATCPECGHALIYHLPEPDRRRCTVLLDEQGNLAPTPIRVPVHECGCTAAQIMKDP